MDRIRLTAASHLRKPGAVRRIVLIGVLLAALASVLIYRSVLPMRQGSTVSEHAVILPLLPPADASQQACQVTIGAFEAAPDLAQVHLEGAVASTSQGFTLVSGFSYFIKSLLIPNARVDRLDESTMTWEVLNTPSPTVASQIQGASYNDQVWIAGGFIGQHPGPAINRIWTLDVKTGQWSEGPELPEARASGGLVASGGLLHYVSGLRRDRQTEFDDHLVLDLDTPTEWQVRSRFPRARNHFQAVTIGDVIFAVGGQRGHDRSVEDLPYLDAWHPSLDAWVPLADLPESRSHAEMSTFVYQGRIIVAGGRSNGQSDRSLNTILEYDPYTDTWRTAGTLPVPLYVPFANVVNDRLYVGGGGHIWNKPQKSAWQADIALECP